MIERLRVGPIGENVYILPLEADQQAKPRPCVIVDPGDEAGRILSFLDDRGFEPELIVCTHGHLDHSAAIPELLAAARERGKALPLAVHPADAAYFGAAGEETNRRLFAAIRALGYFKSYWRELPAPDLLLEDGAFLPHSAWRVIHTPGHTRGSLCLYQEALGLLISGDTLFRDGVGRTDGPDSDEAELVTSIKRRLFELPAETEVFPGHGEPTTIGHERGH